MQPDAPSSAVQPAHSSGRGVAFLPELCVHEETVRIGSRSIHCAIGRDNGPPVVLFHGVTRCWRDFEPILPGLLGRFHVFAPDHRGHGGSSRELDYRVADFAGDAEAFLEAHLREPAVLIGHSLGAMVAACVAAGRPERVRGLVLEDPPGTALAEAISRSQFQLQFANTQRALAENHDVDSLSQALAAMLVHRPSDGAVVCFREIRDAAAIRFGAQCLLQMDPAVLETLLAGRWLEGLDWFGALPRISCPTLLLRGDRQCGGMLDSSESDRMVSLIPRCTRRELPGVGHSIHSAQPARMLGLLDEFFQEHGLLGARPIP
jgi:pimeloyl-ACP methyl ester carboxylesterase